MALDLKTQLERVRRIFRYFLMFSVFWFVCIICFFVKTQGRVDNFSIFGLIGAFISMFGVAIFSGMRLRYYDPEAVQQVLMESRIWKIGIAAMLLYPLVKVILHYL